MNPKYIISRIYDAMEWGPTVSSTPKQLLQFGVYMISGLSGLKLKKIESQTIIQKFSRKYYNNVMVTNDNRLC